MLIAKANTENATDIFERAAVKSEPVIFSTDTICGIGAPLTDSLANEKIFEIKGREKDKPFPVLIGSIEQLEDLAVIETDKQMDIISKIWPAPVTLILKAKKSVPELFKLNSTIAVRMPDKEWLRNTILHTGAMSATSANLSGAEYKNDLDFIVKCFQKYVNFYIYENHTATSSSALIDISSPEIKILRKSAIISKIEAILG